jgi:hypothetical protein
MCEKSHCLGDFLEQFYIMLRMIFPGIPARTFATSFFSGAYQERSLWFDVCVCIRILRAVCL